MSEIDSLTVKLNVDASGAKEGSVQFREALGSTGKTVNETVTATEKLNSNMGKSGESASKNAIKLRQLENQYTKLSLSLEKYQRKASAAIEKEVELRKKIDEATKRVNDAMKESKNYSRAVLEDTEGLPELREQIAQTIDEQLKYADASGVLTLKLEELKVKQESLVSSQEELAQGGDKTQRGLVTMGASAAATAADLAGAGGLSDSIRQAGSAISAFALSGGSGIGIFVASLGALTAVASAVKGAVEENKKQAEEARRAFDEAKASAADYGEDLRSATGALQSLQDARSSTDDLTAANEVLARQFPNLIIGYDNYGNAILASNEAIQVQIDKIKEFEKIENARAKSIGIRAIAVDTKEQIKNADALVKKQKELEGTLSALKTMREDMERGRLVGEQYSAIADAESRIKTLEKEIEDLSYVVETGALNLGSDIQSLLLASLSEMDNLSEAQLVAARDYINTNWEALAEDFEGLVERGLVSEQLKTTMTNVLSNVGVESDAVRVAQDQLSRSADDLGKTYETLAEKLSLAQRMQDLNRLKAYVDVLKNGDKNTKEWAEASAEIAKRLSITETELQKNIKGYAAIALKLDGVTESEYDAMIAAIELELAALNAELAVIGMADSMATEMQSRINELSQMRDIFVGIAGDVGAEPTPRRTGGGGSRERKAAWEEELDLIDRVRSETDDLGEVYIAVLEKMLANQKLSAEERKRVEKELEYANKAVAGQLQEDYIAYLENVLETQKLNADQRLGVEKKLVEAQKQLAQERIEAEQKRIAELDALGNAVAEALRRRYEAEKTMQEESLAGETERVKNAAKEQIAAINATRDARIAALNAEIRALDDAWKARQRIKEDETDEKRLARLRTQLELEKDAYNHQKLREQIAQVEEGITERDAQRAYQDEKQRLQDEIAAARENAQQQIDSINAVTEADLAAFEARKAAQDAYWKERISNEELQLEALYVLNNESNEDILKLLEEYNPEYLQTGLDLGQMLYDGFNEKYEDLLKRTKEVAGEIISQASAATAAWREMQSAVGGGSSSSSGSSTARAAVSPATFNLQEILEIPDIIHAATIGALERMVAAPRAYYAQKEQEAFAAGASTFAMADIGRASVGAPASQPVKLTDQDRLKAAGYSGRRIENLNIYIQQPVTSEYEIMRAARLELEKLSRMDLI